MIIQAKGVRKKPEEGKNFTQRRKLEPPNGMCRQLKTIQPHEK